MRLFAAVTSLGLITAFATGHADDAKPTQVRIGALNVEWLGSPVKRSGPANSG
ncbi:MAG: hypothetical protein ACJ8C4_18125 [Gemmataceae bacterium]